MEENFRHRPIAFTDLETTGFDPDVHEIIEVGLLLVDQQEMIVMSELDLKIRPTHLSTADPESLIINGYNEEDWLHAWTLAEAMAAYSTKTKDAVFCAHNVTFDWSFIHRAFKSSRFINEMDHHRFDLFSLAWATLRNSSLTSFSLDTIAGHFGLPEETKPHRAINGARRAYEIYKLLMSVQTSS
jgi:DNA polymerase III epsilon subunit-like protein